MKYEKVLSENTQQKNAIKCVEMGLDMKAEHV